MQVDVAAHIKILLYKNDRVIVPNLGGFNAIYQPATIEPHGHIIPPTKLISFDKELTFNDNLLIERIVAVEHLSYQEAVNQVDIFVQDINLTLDKGQNTTFSVEDVGRLYVDFEQKLKFVADGENFLMEAFGLPSVEYFPVARKNYATEIVPVQTVQSKVTIGSYFLKLWQDRYLRYFIGITIILLLFISFSEYINNPSKRVNPSYVEEPKDINDQNNVVAENEIINPFPEMDNSEIDKSLISEEVINETTIAEEEASARKVNQSPIKVSEPTEIIDNTPLPTQPVINETVPVSSDVHLVMVGAYGKVENAQKAFKKLIKQGYEPHLEDIQTKFRVGIKIKGDSEKLKKQLQKIRKTYPSAWLKK